MSNILVTGSSGFLGAYVVKNLTENGDSVIAFDLKTPINEQAWLLNDVSKSVNYVKGTVEDQSTLIRVIREHKVDMVVHAASVVDPEYLLHNPLVAYRINLGGTLNILEAVRLEGLKRIVYISTNGIFVNKKYEPIDEDHPVISANQGPGNGPYSASKLASEAFGLSYASAFGIKFISLRPSAIYGFGMQYPMYIKPMVENSVKGLPTRFAAGKNIPRDYTHVMDVTEAVTKALHGDKLQDSIFLIATGNPLVTPGQIMELIGKKLPGSDIQIGEGLNEWNKREVGYRARISIQRAKDQLGYCPKYDIEAGVEEYINTYRQYLGAQQ